MIATIIQTPRFQRHIQRAFAIAERDPSDHPLEKVLAFYAATLTNGTTDPTLTAQHLYKEVQRHFGPPPQPLKSDVLRTLIMHLKAHRQAPQIKGRNPHA